MLRYFYVPLKCFSLLIFFGEYYFCTEYEEAIENLVASDVDLYLELGELNNGLTVLNNAANDVSTTVIELDTELMVLEDTVSQIDTRLSQLEVSGSYR